jgi:hypothetical protein
MNTARLKTATVGFATLLGLGMAAYIGFYFFQRDRFQEQVTTERMKAVLDAVPDVVTQVEDIVDRARFERALQGYDWTAKPPPEKPVEVATQATEPEKRPIDRLVKLKLCKVDAATPEYGECVLKYLADARVTVPNDGVVRKVVGDRLDQALSYIRIASITEAGVEFAYDDGRPSEFLVANDFPLTGYVVVDGDTIVQVTRPQVSIPQAMQRYVSGPKTQEISPTKFRLGTEDVDQFAQNYPEILTRDVGYRQHRDPRTGKYDGIEVTRVEPGSIVARHGVQSGDVIKSINGEPVSSREEAINYVKANQDVYDRWEVEIENRGQTRIVTYLSPSK